MTMHVCRCGPGGRWWQPTRWLHVCHYGPGGRWWQPNTGFMTAYGHLQADCLESGISSGPVRSTTSIGTFTFTFITIIGHRCITESSVVLANTESHMVFSKMQQSEVEMISGRYRSNLMPAGELFINTFNMLITRFSLPLSFSVDEVRWRTVTLL